MRNLILFALFLLIACNQDNQKQNTEIPIAIWEYDREDIDLSATDFPAQGYKTEAYVFHCTATPENREVSKEWLLNFFYNERGWGKAGYNLMIHLDGSVDTLVPFDLNGFTQYHEISNGVRGLNHKILNFAYVGGVDQNMKAKDTRTPEQRFAIAKIVHEIKLKDRGAKIHGHRDNAGVIKACPSFDFEKEYGKNCK